MAATLDLPQLLALAAVLGFASGLRLYAVLLVVGLVGWAGWVELPAGLQVLQHPQVLIASGAMCAVELVADKIPWIDSAWDSVQTFIRIPAGAALAAAALGGVDGAVWTVVAAIVGGSLAATSHFAKSGTRAAANTSPEPLSNAGLSVAEDLTVGGLLWLAFAHPWIALAAVVVLAVAAIWLLSKVLRTLRRVFRWLAPRAQQP